MRTVYLVDLGTGSNRNLLPLGIGLISSYAKAQEDISAAFDIHLHFLRGDPEEIAASFDDPAVVGLACYVWNLKASMRLVDAVKRRWPSCLIVAGGYSIPRDPKRIAAFFAAHPVDILIHGEGEETFADLLRHEMGCHTFNRVAGITCRSNLAGVDTSGRHVDPLDTFFTTPPRKRIADLNAIPSPFLNGTFDALMATHGDKVTGAVWETNRGCPYSCTFCDWGDSSVTKVKQFALDRLDAEAEWIARNKIPYVYLADANFGIFYERDLHIARRLASMAKEHGAPHFLALNWLKNSHEKIVHIADALAEGGVKTSVTLAVQSFHKPVLDAIKRKNVNTDALKAVLRNKGQATYTEMILGLPEETYETWLAGLNQAMSSPFLSDHWVFHLCTLLVNTEMDSAAYRARYGIEGRTINAAITRRLYDVSQDEPETEEIVVGTNAMPIDDWREAYAVGYLAAVLHNFRVAFFLMHHVQRECGTAHTDFIAFVLKTVEQEPARYPHMTKGIEHLRRQQQMILDGIACLSPVAELGGAQAHPHEAVLAILLDDPVMLYRDLSALTQRFLTMRGHAIDRDALRDIVAYQRARMPAWGAASAEQRFRCNVPAYFDAITRGQEPPPLRQEWSNITVMVAASTAADRFQFAVRRTRSGHTIALNAAAPRMQVAA